MGEKEAALVKGIQIKDLGGHVPRSWDFKDRDPSIIKNLAAPQTSSRGKIQEYDGNMESQVFLAESEAVLDQIPQTRSPKRSGLAKDHTVKSGHGPRSH